MEIFFSHYRYTPLKRLNRTSSMEPKHGVYLKAHLSNRITYADYFPHAAFGDKGVNQFLTEFKFQKNEYERKILHFLNHDQHYQTIPQKHFYNHQLWTGTEDLEASVIKYKLLRPNDDTFIDPLKRGLKIRLDANGLFNRDGLKHFIALIPPEYLPQIDYMEDPLVDKEWNDLGVRTACDLINGSPHDVHIHRPNCRFYPETESKVIFSSYLGGELGRWHTYCELVEKGDFNQIHGIVSRGYYREEKYFLTGSYETGFCPDPMKVKEVYQDLQNLEWKYLCSV